MKRVLKTLVCDVCGKEAERYIVIYPRDGQMILDRCSDHNKRVVALRQEKGEWRRSKHGSRNAYKVSDPDELMRQFGEDK